MRDPSLWLLITLPRLEHSARVVSADLEEVCRLQAVPSVLLPRDLSYWSIEIRARKRVVFQHHRRICNTDLTTSARANCRHCKQRDLLMDKTVPPSHHCGPKTLDPLCQEKISIGLHLIFTPKAQEAVAKWIERSKWSQKLLKIR